MTAMVLATLAVFLNPATPPQEKPQHVWKPFQFFTGKWEGAGEGKPGVSRGKMECYAKGVMTRTGSKRPATKKRKKSAKVSPPYEIHFSLNMTSPFVPDGRMSLAGLSLKVIFTSVTFEFDADEDPLLGRCQVNTAKGKGKISRLVLNDVQKGDERLLVSFLSVRPREFSAGLGIESEPMAEDEAAARSTTAPKKVRLAFWTEFVKTPVRWGSKFGTASLADLKVIFEVPFRDLLRGKAYSLTLPYEGLFPEDKGTWTINLRTELKKK